MASCPKCDGFSARFNIGTLREYRDIVRQLIEIVNEGTFWLVRRQVGLDVSHHAPVSPEGRGSIFSLTSSLIGWLG